jgi:hypothetical protein
LGVCAYNLHRIGAELMRQAGEGRLKQVAWRQKRSQSECFIVYYV